MGALVTFMRAVSSLIEMVARVAAIVSVAVVLTVMCSQVFARYVMNSSLQWSEEASIWAMIWMVFMGSTSVFSKWEHIYIPTVITLFPLRVKAALILFSRLLAGVFLVALAYYGFDVIAGPANAFSHNIGLSTAWAKAAIPVGSGMMVIVVVAHVLDDIADILNGDFERFAGYGTFEGQDV